MTHQEYIRLLHPDLIETKGEQKTSLAWHQRQIIRPQTKVHVEPMNRLIASWKKIRLEGATLG